GVQLTVTAELRFDALSNPVATMQPEPAGVIRAKPIGRYEKPYEVATLVAAPAASSGAPTQAPKTPIPHINTILCITFSFACVTQRPRDLPAGDRVYRETGERRINGSSCLRDEPLIVEAALEALRPPGGLEAGLDAGRGDQRELVAKPIGHQVGVIAIAGGPRVAGDPVAARVVRHVRVVEPRDDLAGGPVCAQPQALELRPQHLVLDGDQDLAREAERREHRDLIRVIAGVVVGPPHRVDQPGRDGERGRRRAAAMDLVQRGAQREE